MDSRLQLRLLGTFDASLDGAPLTGFRSAKVRALLAYLAVETAVLHRRDALAALLWGEYPERDAQRSLSQALTNLRSLLAPLASGRGAAEPTLEITGQTVCLRVEPERVWVDLHAFDRLVAQGCRPGTPAPGDAPQAGLLAEAVDLYRGPFLSGLVLRGGPAFEEWRLLQQEQHHQAALLALERLVAHHLGEGRSDEVERYARRQLALEPWNEVAHQSLMLALALSGRRGAALRQFEACREVLAGELGVEPSPETEALRRQIRDAAWGDLALPQCGPPGAHSGLLPSAFVAREQEMARLDQSLDSAFVGQGRVVLVTGEAGSGKTALLAHFARRAVTDHRRLVAAAGRCSAFAGLGDPFLPFRQILRALCGESGAAADGYPRNPDHMRRLWALFPAAAQALVENGPDLVGRFVPAENLEARAATLAPAGAAWLRRLAELKELARSRPPSAPDQGALFDQVTAVLHAIARKQPLLLLVDDLQWADTASLSLLFHLGRQLEGCRILIVGAYRPSEIAPGHPRPPEEGWGEEAPPLQSLAREFARQWGAIRIDLDRAGGRHFVDALLDSEPNRLGAAFRERLAGQTGGHALFTVELLRAFQERGELVRDAEGRWVQGEMQHGTGLPPRVEAVIAERIDRLPQTWKRVLEAACIEGEAFSAEVAADVTGSEPTWVRELLGGPLSAESQLVQPLGVERLGDASAALSRYRFGHALFQEYLYAHLDAVQRARLHGRVGAALEELCRGQAAALAEISPRLAHHCEEAGQPDRAAQFLLLAGRRATRLTAYEEAISLYRHGLDLLRATPDSPGRRRHEIDLLLALDLPVCLVRGSGAPARAEVLAAAHSLAIRLGEPQVKLRVLLLLIDLHTWHGEVAQALARAEEVLHRAEVAHDLSYLGAGHLAAGLCHMQLGHLAAGREHLEQALAWGTSRSARPAPQLEPEQRPVRPPLVPAEDADIEAASLGWLSVLLCYMGHLDQAQVASRRGRACIDDLADPLTIFLVHITAGACFHALRREPSHLKAAAESLRGLVRRHNLGYAENWATYLLGLAQAWGGQSEEGIASMCAGLAQMETGGTLAFRPLLHGLLAEALLEAGRWREGAEVLDTLGIYKGRAYEAEVHRLRGELLLRAGDGPWSMGHTPSSGEPSPSIACLPCSTPEALFREALELARRQGAHLFELRAAMSLARLWRAHGRSEEAHEVLTGVHAWFTEGLDLPDLAQARAMLAE